ncbi:MAG: replication-relaxation family protein [Anaerolineae bacterium]|nr:replication-relaxation family protein [Anaerolineae bacterium]
MFLTVQRAGDLLYPTCMSDLYRTFVDHDRRPASKWTALQLTERDRGLFECIYAYGGVLASRHIHQLVFPSTNGRACQLRLSRLFHQDYLARTRKIGTFYWLTRRGMSAIAANVLGGIPQSQFGFTPRWAQLDHDLRIVDILLAMQMACAGSGGVLKINQWWVERDLRGRVTAGLSAKQAGQLRSVIPDAYIQIDRYGEGQHPFHSRLLLEVDNGTHPNPRFAEHKVLPGLEWLKSKAYQQQFGAARGRWLVVTTSDKRLAYLKDTVQRVAGKQAMIWHFTTMNQLTAQTALTEPIWYRAGDRAQPVALFPTPQ